MNVNSVRTTSDRAWDTPVIIGAMGVGPAEDAVPPYQSFPPGVSSKPSKVATNGFVLEFSAATPTFTASASFAFCTA
jgi:hypothetical protein